MLADKKKEKNNLSVMSTMDTGHLRTSTLNKPRLYCMMQYGNLTRISTGTTTNNIKHITSNTPP